MPRSSADCRASWPAIWTFAISHRFGRLRPASAPADSLGAIVFSRHLPAGVLVNDVQTRRLLMFDSTLTHVTVVADTTSATANAYSGRMGGLIAYRGDSSLFVDPQSMSMLVIDP